MGHRAVILRGWVLVILLLASGAARSSAGAWTQPQGRLWLKVGSTFGYAHEKFANDRVDSSKLFPDGRSVQAGDRIPFDFTTGGRYRYQAHVVEGAYGLSDQFELAGTLPVLHTRFDNDNDEVEPGTGFGDLRLATAIGLYRGARGVVSVAFEWKLPTADVPRSVYAQPLGEGQHDLTAWLRAGRSLWPVGWAQLEVGHRWRASNDDLGFDPGREWHFRGEFGWQLLSSAALKIGVEGLEGEPWTSNLFGFEQELGTRRLWSATPGLLLRLARLGAPRSTLEISGSIAIVGEDLPVARELRVAWMLELGS